MSEGIILPKESKEEEQIEIKYQATEKDEEEFFLMYHLNWPPSEVKALGDDYRQWLIARFVGQRKMEDEAMAQHRMRAALGPNLAV